MIEVEIGSLLELDATARIALAELRNNTPGRRFDHLRQHAILDAEAVVVLEKDDLVAGREIADTILRPEGMAGPASST